ncbi:MAG: cupredoxin domain-containing protein [Candidatus Saccharimonadales bacterium]
MKRSTLLTIGLILLVLLGLGMVWLLLAQTKTQQPAESNKQTTPQQQKQTESTTPTSQPQEQQSISIVSFAFTPAKMTVKKGTKVVWTNEDSVGHNVVSDADAPAGGPPKTAAILQQGESFEFVFDTVGTFRYHCTPHPNMTGTIEVVE